MWVLQKFLLASLFVCVLGGPHRFLLIQDNITLDYFDPGLLDISLTLCEVKNNEKGINLTFTLRKDLPENIKFTIDAYKFVKNGYQVEIIKFNKRFKEATEMELFDLESLWMEHSRPPIIWPLEKGVTYSSVGWNPDTRKFPPTIPNGKYKVKISLVAPGAPDSVTANWYIRIVPPV